MTDISNTKEIVKRATLGILNRINNAISIAFGVDILIRNKNLYSEEHKTKNCSK